MKKGDVISKETPVVAGTMIGSFVTQQQATQYIENNGLTGSVNKSGSAWIAVAQEGCVGIVEAKVNWIVEYEVGVTYLTGNGRGLCGIVDLREEPEWKVLRSAVPTYQSSVEQLTVEQLQESIDKLRTQRRDYTPTKTKKPRKAKEPKEDNSPLAQALKGMNEEQKLALKKKLGLI